MSNVNSQYDPVSSKSSDICDPILKALISDGSSTDFLICYQNKKGEEIPFLFLVNWLFFCSCSFDAMVVCLETLNEVQGTTFRLHALFGFVISGVHGLFRNGILFESFMEQFS